jgi:hypothetical protein
MEKKGSSHCTEKHWAFAGSEPVPYWDRHSGHANPDPADPEIRIVINSKLMNFNLLSKILKIFTL